MAVSERPRPEDAVEGRGWTVTDPDGNVVETGPESVVAGEAVAGPVGPADPSSAFEAPEPRDGVPPPPAEVPPSSGHPDWSPSLRSVIDRLAGQQVPIQTLVEAMLELHGDEYLGPWSWTAPQWPTDPLSQSTERWMQELEAILVEPHVFGRIAILGWCLLDDRVASAAQASGMLAGIAAGVTPRVRNFLTSNGMHLLRRRAPLVALTVGELPAALELPGAPGAGALTCVAVDSPTAGAAWTIGAWAAASAGQVFVGNGARSRPALPEGATAEVVALGFTGNHRLGVVTRLGAAEIDPATLASEQKEDWPAASSAMVSAGGIVAAPADDKGEVVWAASNGGGPVPLPGVEHPSGALVAAAEGRVAALTDDRLLRQALDRVGSAWVAQPLRALLARPTVLTATAEHVLLGNSAGEVQAIRWDATAQPTTAHRALDGPVRHAAGSRHLAAMASEREVVLVSGETVQARFRPALKDGEEISAVGLSEDGAILAVCVPLGVRFWRIDAVPEVRLTSYTSDTPDGDDLLGIRPTVDALAAILVARAVEPPLSIGLFGAWGSGKTFFMRRLQQRVVELSADSHSSGRAQASLWAWRNVRQVRFNAWHYAAADVWAGLLEQLVRELARPADRGNLELDLPAELSVLEQRRVQQLAGAVDRVKLADEELDTAERRLQEAAQAAEDQAAKLEEARAEVARVRTSTATELLQAESVQGLDRALEAAGLPKVGASLDTTLREIDEARASLRSATGLARSARGGGLALGLVGVLIGAVLLTVLLQRLDVDLAGVFGLMAAALGAVGATARWVTSAAATVQSRLGQYDDAERAARAAAAELADRLAQAQGEVERARADVEGMERQLEQAELRLVEARQQAESATPGDLLVEYLGARDTGDEYRRLLGLIGTVRRDLEVISEAIARNNRAAEEQLERPPDDVVNRVVLYIDDLDRCPPAVVVRVLEAVSMLLTFPMFVVVVAVDAHWISKSLASVYPDLLTGGDVTPDNYLEKIFQMPVWLERPSDEAAAAMARVLLAGPAPQPDAPEARASAADQRRTAAPPDGEPVTSAAGRVEPAYRPEVALSTSPPEAVTLDASEVSAIADLAPLVARSPRALKRYLNTYRVLKALVGTDDLASVRLLLAVATGRPDLGERVLAGILAAPDGQTLGGIIEAWPAVDQVWLDASIPDSLPEWRALECLELKPVASEVRRFVFHAEHDEDLTQPAPAPPDAAPAR